MSHLLVLSIGPVQDFIAAGRKTRDLWFGSELLSDLAAAAAIAIQEAGGELIFPAPDDDGSIGGSAPNKIVAIVPADPAASATAAVAAARARLLKHREEVAKTAGRGIERLIDWGLLDRQLAHFIESYAAWHPYDPTHPEEYPRARQAAEGLLAGRKALRDFAPADGVDGVPKSSLDGGRETVLRIRRDERGREEDSRVLGQGDVKIGEQLDGISLIKRLAPARRFVSVSRIAIDPLLREVGDPRLGELRALAEQLRALRSPLLQELPASLGQYAAFPYDGELFYGGLDDAAPGDEQILAERFRDLVRAMARARGLIEPPTYMAVLVADGDRVGRAIGDLATPDHHRQFSRAGSRFAGDAEALVARHQGALVYSGGDDVLAFLPLDTALDCAGELHATFDSAMADLPLSQKPTLSVGISIGYYSEPLGTLLAWGRAAEAHAKAYPHKNALAVALHTRSGGTDDAIWRGGWGAATLPDWARWVGWFRDDVVPDGAAYELRTLAQELRALAQAGQPESAARLVDPEARRILGNKRGQRGTQEITGAAIDAIVDAIGDRDPAPPENGARRADPAMDAVAGLENTVTQMIIARHFARAQDGADGRGSHAR